MRKERIELLLGILILIAVCCGVYLLAPSHRTSDSMARGIETPPPITEAIAKRIQESSGFAAVVSYTEAGFEPQTTTIKKGETVRFVNNQEKRAVWVAATGEDGTRYPQGGAECGQSALDSCSAIGAGDFWEFTFEKPGTWSFKNNAAPEYTGVIIVQ